MALPLRRLTRRRAVGTAEAAFPQFQQRLTTFAERDGHDPFIELLAGDTLEVAQSAEPKQMVTDRRLWISLATGVGAFAVLIWMIAAGPGFLGYGASLLWTGPHHDKPALYDLRVTPGDAVVRRHADQMVSALPTGLRSPSVKLYARFQSSSKWEEIAMQPQAAGSFAGGYQFLFAGLPENVEYYVTAGAMTSKHFNIRVTDLPAVKQIRVTYHYPAWTGMPSEIEERGGDLRAVIGTEAELEVSTDRPLQGGQIQLDSGQQIQLTGGQNNVYRGTVKMDQDGVYHVAGVEQGQPVRVSEDFFIEARKANPPQIALVRPGRGDYHASPIEEVTVAAKATDEYGLNGVDAALFGERRPRDCGGSAQAKGREASRRLDHALAGGFQARSGRSGQRLRHRQGRQRRSPHRHDVHPGRPVRARVFAIAAVGRRWRRRRRRRRSIRADLAAREGNHIRHLQTAGRQELDRSSRPPTSPSCCPNPKPLCAIRPSRFPAACRPAS